jgi:hypothetical protein
MAVTVLYEQRLCVGQWYAIGGEENFAALRIDHIQVGQDLQYEQGEDTVYWRITDVLEDGQFIAVPIYREGYANEPRHFQLVVSKTRKNAPAAEHD